MEETVDLLRKAELVDWMPSERKWHYEIFSRSGIYAFCIKYCEENHIKMYDLDELKRSFGP